MQTLAGLALDTKHDTKHQGSTGESMPGGPSHGSQRAVQHLLNAFAMLNVLHFLSLFFLAHLDRRKKAAQAAEFIPSIHVSHGEIMTNDANQPKSTNNTNDITDAGGSIRLPPSDREGPFPSAASSERTPLLPGRENAPKPKEVKRGELFVALCTTLVVFAWVLFLVTAWSRLRSKAEREGGTAVVYEH
jgi:hypothetical protein